MHVRSGRVKRPLASLHAWERRPQEEVLRAMEASEERLDQDESVYVYMCINKRKYVFSLLHITMEQCGMLSYRAPLANMLDITQNSHIQQ